MRCLNFQGQQASIDQDLMSNFEQFFSCSLKDTKILIGGEDTPGLPLASASRNTIVVSKRLAMQPGVVQELVLAHEMAHVVQLRSRRAKDKSDCLDAVLEIELEAAVAAVAWMSGADCPKLSRACDTTLFWNEIGHYYTVYLVALLIGMKDDAASDLAFYAQLPDQVYNLDAIIEVAHGRKLAIALTKLMPAHASQLLNYSGRYFDIQQALHCLTGGIGYRETMTRADLFRHLRKPLSKYPVEHGLALHAFGDSFAHRKGDTDEASLYSAPLGHFLGGVLDGSLESVKTHGSHIVHTEDWLGSTYDLPEKRSALYSKYVRALFELLRESHQGTAVWGASSDKIAERVCASSGGPQKALIKGEINRLGGRNSYDPESEPVSWKAYAQKYPKRVNDEVLERAHRTLVRWSLDKEV